VRAYSENSPFLWKKGRSPDKRRVAARGGAFIPHCNTALQQKTHAKMPEMAALNRLKL
jgi:hypothetical protein